MGQKHQVGEARERAARPGVRWGRVAVAASLGLWAIAPEARAEDTLDSGDTAWILVSTALVLFMTIPGLALFYGGLVRTKNVLSVLMQCMALTGVITVVWLALRLQPRVRLDGHGRGTVNLKCSWAVSGQGLPGAASTGDDALGDDPRCFLFVVFQMTFAIITPALIVGAFAERMKLLGHADLLVALAGRRLPAHLPHGLGR